MSNSRYIRYNHPMESDNQPELAAFMQGMLERLYASSEPVAVDSPLARITTDLCGRAAISHVPELRDQATLLSGDAATLIDKNTILFNNTRLPESEAALKGLIAHELGHLVFGDDYKSLGVEAERRADRFTRFLTGDASAYVEYLGQSHAETEKQLAAMKAQGELEAMEAREQEMLSKLRYGNIEERIANIMRPVSETEKVEFRRAVAKYNARVEHGKHTKTPLIPVSSENKSLPERTIRLAEIAEAKGADEAALRLANVTERAMRLIKKYRSPQR